MNARERRELDNHITGHGGEDQFEPERFDEMTGPCPQCDTHEIDVERDARLAASCEVPDLSDTDQPHDPNVPHETAMWLHTDLGHLHDHLTRMVARIDAMQTCLEHRDQFDHNGVAWLQTTAMVVDSELARIAKVARKAVEL